jgi:hypothetical protein
MRRPITHFSAVRAGVLLALCVSMTVVLVGASIAQAKPFGISSFSQVPVERTTETLSGPLDSYALEYKNEPYATPFTQAGGHPWALTTKFAFETEEVKQANGEVTVLPTHDPKDIVNSLPPGLLGDPMAVPQCPLTRATGSGEFCPGASQIGFWSSHQQGGHQVLAPIVNVTPEAGQSAEFALENRVKLQTPLLTAHLVRTAQGYGFTVAGIDQPAIGLQDVELTFWGVPADPSHDPWRGRFCTRPSKSSPLLCLGGGESAGVAPVPFVTLPTDCAAGPQSTVLRADSWQEPGSVREGHYSGYSEKSFTMPAVTGCDLLGFAPSVEVHPETQVADEPSGLEVDLGVPLSEAPGAFATPQVRDSSVTLPEGMSVSPGVVDGIQACNEFGPEGIDITGPESEEVGPSGELQLASGHCPDASTVGTAEAITPFLPIPIKGHVYLARPACGGPEQPACTEEDAADGRLYRLYLELGGEGELGQTGIHFKVPLETHANPATGQLTATAVDTPQAPFSELKIHLNGGPRAPLDTPAACGPATTTADLTPWSAPGVTPEGLAVPGTPDATSSSFFAVEGCPGTPPLNPGFSAGTVSPQAGAYSAFTMNLSRGDREQYVKGIQIHTPPGLLGMLSSVPLCEEPLADSGHCPEASKIGTTRVASGAGSHPFEIGGSVYLTKSYGGAPFGLSIVTDAIAGPFNLGLVIVRARISVNPETSALTITTDETGPYAIPQIIFGVPLRLQRITVNIDRPGFMFNPTSCAQQQIAATISGSQQATANLSSPFAAAGCKSLAFKPSFAVSTSGHTSRANGASLDAKLSYPAGSVGSEANIARVKVDLPKQLPSRLTTLQKACTAQTFESNPANCPAASIVGIVKTSTPLLPVELTGPVYFVSHGGEAFPSLIVVLQGDGVRVDLTGSTFISKTGITSSTFKTVPDVPVNTFEIYLPEGKYSALAANGNLCTSKLSMPTAFVAQNGAEIHETTKIAVTGCSKAKAAKKKTKKKTKNGRGKAKKSSNRSI